MKKTDRCDRCGAEAIHRFTVNGLELMFCQHHTNKYRESLANQGFQNVESKELIDA